MDLGFTYTQHGTRLHVPHHGNHPTNPRDDKARLTGNDKRGNERDGHRQPWC